jgi:hypothetical protein
MNYCCQPDQRFCGVQPDTRESSLHEACEDVATVPAQPAIEEELDVRLLLWGNPTPILEQVGKGRIFLGCPGGAGLGKLHGGNEVGLQSKHTEQPVSLGDHVPSISREGLRAPHNRIEPGGHFDTRRTGFFGHAAATENHPCNFPSRFAATRSTTLTATRACLTM